jgi:preprotein translocase subunit SecA
MFFLSVDDDLMRIFAGDKLEGLLANSKMGLREGDSDFKNVRAGTGKSRIYALRSA